MSSKEGLGYGQSPSVSSENSHFYLEEGMQKMLMRRIIVIALHAIFAKQGLLVPALLPFLPRDHLLPLQA